MRIAVERAKAYQAPTVQHKAQLSISHTLMHTLAPLLVLQCPSDSRVAVHDCAVLAPRPCAWRDAACGDQRGKDIYSTMT